MKAPKLMMMADLEARLDGATEDEKVQIVAEQLVAVELFANRNIENEDKDEDEEIPERLRMLLEPRPSKGATWYEWMESRAQVMDAMALGGYFVPDSEGFVERTIEAAVELKERLGY